MNAVCFFGSYTLLPYDSPQIPTPAMLTLDEKEIESRVQASSDVKNIHAKITHAAAELSRAHAALQDVPASVRATLFASQEAALEALRQEEERVEEQARQWAVRALQDDHVNVLRAQARPLLQKTQKALETARENLKLIVQIEAEARSVGGGIMTERLDLSAVDYFIPKLTHQAERNTWQLKR